MKLVINTCYGGFELSDKAEGMLGEDTYELERDDPKLVEIVETLGKEAYNTDVSKLSVVEIPDNATDYEVNEYDGYESIIYVVDGKIHHVY